MTDLYCRLCAKITPEYDLVDIVDNKNNLECKIFKCLQLKITVSDSLPKHSCVHCETKVCEYYTFYEEVKKAQETLEAEIQLQKVETKIEGYDNIVSPKTELNDCDIDHFSDNDIENGSIKSSDRDEKSTKKVAKKLKPEIKKVVKRKKRNTSETPKEINEMKEAFYNKINSSDLKENINIISDESYARYIREVEEASLGDVSPKKMPIDYRRIAKFEIYMENNVKKLIVPISKTKNNRIKYYVPKSELFDHIRNAHLQCGHGGRTRTETLLKTKYKNITRRLITTYINLCKICAGRRKIIRDNEADSNNLKKKMIKKEAEPLTVAGYEWKCRECNEIVPTARDLDNHYEFVHGKPVEYVCVECSKVYNSYVPFRNHLLRHRNKFRFRCEICCNYFSSGRKLRNHRELHNKNRKKYFCSKCGKGFFCESSIARHERLKHSGIIEEPRIIVKRHECDVCHKMFASISILNYHKKIHSGVREHTCEHCGKSFVRKQYLEEHITLHSEERPYKCDLCPSSFKVKVCLKRHLFLHTGIKPFQCDICGKKFPRKPALQEHSIKHTDLYPFKCEACNKGFRFKRNLIRHTRLHTGEKPYSCSMCNRHFTCSSNYDKHMKRHHGVVKVKKEIPFLQ